MKRTFPRKIGILADDLTGAGDVGLPFWRAGFPVEVSILPKQGNPSKPTKSTLVWIIDTDTRDQNPRLAKKQVLRAVRLLRHWGADFLYKKIDSTLRGCLRDELRAFLAHGVGGAKKPVLFIPAFPRMGRKTIGGTHFVEGKPIHKTAFGRDPRQPVSSSQISTLLASETEKILCPNVWNQKQMRYWAKAVLKGSVFPRAAVGSAGLAEELAWQLGKRRKVSKNFRNGALEVLPKRGTTLVVVGSVHPTTTQQVDYLLTKARGGGSKIHLTMGPRTAKNSLITPSKAIITGAKSRPIYLFQTSRVKGPLSKMKRNLMGMVRQAFSQVPFGTVVATGGATSRWVADLFKINRFFLKGEIERGVPLCQGVGSNRKNPLIFILKPGGFGKRTTLARCVGNI